MTLLRLFASGEHGMGVPAARIAAVRAILLKRSGSYAILAGIQIPAWSDR